MNRFYRRQLLAGFVMVIAVLGLSGCSADGSGEDTLTVYTAGQYNDGTKDIPCYWTGTTRTDLAGDGAHGVTAHSVSVSGGTVYTAGSYTDGLKSIPCYWTGTTRTDLPGDGVHGAEAHEIFLK